MRLIDADAFIRDVKNYYLRNGYESRDIHLSLGDVIAYVDSAYKIRTKTIHIEPKRGKWLRGDEMPNFPRIPYKPWMRYCSECGDMTAQDDNALFNFCPSCGADMR